VTDAQVLTKMADWATASPEQLDAHWKVASAPTRIYFSLLWSLELSDTKVYEP